MAPLIHLVLGGAAICLCYYVYFILFFLCVFGCTAKLCSRQRP